MDHSGGFNSTPALVSPDVKLYLAERFLATQVLASTWPVIILFGMVANSVNIVVFLKTGAKDNVTILLLGLAMSDILFLSLVSPSMCGVFIGAFVRPRSWPFDANILFYLLYWPAYTAYDLSTFISVSLGLMRCACVTMPLKFKSIFTRSRTLKWLVFLIVFAVSLRTPVLTIFRIGRRKNLKTNISEPYLVDVNNKQMTRLNDILNRGVMMYLSFITMIVCVIILSFKLYEASKIRRSCTAKVTIDSQSKPDKSSKQRVSSKDLQVIQSVTLVCVIFILSQLTFVVTSLIRLMNSEFNSGGRLHSLFGIFSQVGMTCSYLNASLNIFVYYRYNSKYRATFRSLLGGKPKE